jgi:hypothetical protein
MATTRVYPSRILVVPDDTYANLYAIFYDLNTGDMFNATTGAVSSTYGDCAVVGAKHASNKSVWLFTTPPIDVDINVGFNLLQNASPADTDIPIKAGKYDPLRNTTYSDATPAGQGKTFIRH